MIVRIYFICFLLFHWSSAETPLLMVKSVKGKVLHFLPHGADKPLNPFVQMGVKNSIETKDDGKTILRLFSASGQLTLWPISRLNLTSKIYKQKPTPFLTLVKGGSEFNFSPEAGPLYLLETENTQIEALGARWYTQFDGESVTKSVILKGSIKIHNRPKDMSAVVPEGKTCYSDKDGLRIVNSTAEDLAQFRQNLLEVDFMDPSTEQLKTLEVEYESNF